MQNQSEIPAHITIKSNSKSIQPKLSALRQQTMMEHTELVRSEVDKLKMSHEKINDILGRISKGKAECEVTIKNLSAEINELDGKIADYDKKAGHRTVEDDYKDNIQKLNEEYLNTCKERVKVSQEVDLKTLRKIDIEDKTSPANQMFKWILSAMYNEPGNKFFWPNFKDEALENDHGKDFIERLGKIPSNNAKQQQKIQTQKFLKRFPEILAAPQLVKHQDNANRIRQIAQNFKKGYDTTKQIKNNEHLIQKFRESTMERDEQSVKWKARSEALKDRLNLNKEYLEMLNNIGAKLNPKSSVYETKIKNGQTLLNEFQSLSQWNPSINLGAQHKGNCECTECSIF